MVTPVFLLGKSHEQRRRVGYGLWGFKELDMTEHNNKAPYQFKYQYIYVASKWAFGNALSLIPFCYSWGQDWESGYLIIVLAHSCTHCVP